ncbi:WXG100 family type VII secretion target [Nonomuraea sp. SBT364]|uniref:WXG100 family type VII secretion target n=1 Tax=Nonomuraea sp. SBT364 TaxID=1580530 RepID=UPI00066AFCB7|nr:WXG100 family type VII secretion target [Nonomuraea sp. SBT364]
MGAEPQTQVSAADLIAAVNLIEEAATRLRTLQSNLDMAGAELKTSWAGQSEAAFAAVHIKWHERMDVILGSLARLAQNIGTSNKNFAAFNEEREQAMNHIANLISAQPPTR